MGYVAYFRVSTKKQGESGLGLESQRAILCHYLQCDDLAAEYTEVASGKGLEGRPVLHEAIKFAIEGGHTLAVAKIDRLSRTTEDALAIWGQLDGRLFSADIPQDNGRMDKFTLTIFMAIADRERELISIRTKAALQAKKERGDSLGNPDIYNPEHQAKAAAANKAAAIADYRQKTGYVEVLREKGMSYKDIADVLNSEGHKTRRGAEFKAMTVKRMLDRVQ